MQYKSIECEAFISIINKKDCAFHQRLGWSHTDWHMHNRGQLIYAEYGVMRLYVENEIFYIPSWHAAWIPEGLRHKVVTESIDLIFRTLYLDCNSLPDEFYKQVSVFYADTLLREMILYTERWALHGAADTHETTFLQSIKHLLPEKAKNAIGLHLPTIRHPKLLEINDFILENLDQKLKTVEVARYFGMSERTMARLFLKELTMPFSQYIRLLRIIKAVELLVLPGTNVTEVAFSVGYESLPTFSNNFLEIMGVRPNFFLER